MTNMFHNPAPIGNPIPSNRPQIVYGSNRFGQSQLTYPQQNLHGQYNNINPYSRYISQGQRQQSNPNALRNVPKSPTLHHSINQRLKKDDTVQESDPSNDNDFVELDSQSSYSMWNKLPIKKNNNPTVPGIIDHLLNKVSYQVDLPDGFRFTDIDPNNNTDVDNLITFLSAHYVMPGYERNRPKFTKKVLVWGLGGVYENYDNIDDNFRPIIITVNIEKNDKIVGCIAARPITYRLHEQCIQTFQVSLLCTHRRLRKKKLAHVLMKEMFNRLNDFGYVNGLIFNLNYSFTNTPLVKPFNWLCRPLNIEKLSYKILKDATQEQINSLSKIYSIRPTNDLSLIRLLDNRDISIVMQLYNDDNKKYQLTQVFNRNEFEYQYLPKPDVVESFVITNSHGVIKDFVSFYTVLTDDGYKYGYLLYFTYKTPELSLIIMKNILFIAQQMGVDMFFVADNMYLGNILKNGLRFKETGTRCNYTIFNYDSNGVDPNNCGLVLPL